MIWIILASLGVPLWLVVGVLAAAVWNRRKVTAQPGTFKMRIRALNGTSVDGPWGRKVYARWAHSVLIINRGPGLGQVRVLPVSSQTRAPNPDPAVCKGLGASPVALSIGTDDGEEFEVAARVEDAEILNTNL